MTPRILTELPEFDVTMTVTGTVVETVQAATVKEAAVKAIENVKLDFVLVEVESAEVLEVSQEDGD